MPSDDFWNDLPGARAAKAAIKKTKLVQSFSDPKDAKPKEETNKPKEPAQPKPAQQAKQETDATISWFGVFGSLFLFVCAALVGTSIWMAQLLLKAADPVSDTSAIFTIKSGQSTQEIASSLENQGLVISRWPVLAYTALKGGTFKAGVYSLSSAQTPQEIAEVLFAGDIVDKVVTIPEGWRIEQIADHLSTLGIVKRSEFLAAATYNPVHISLPAEIKLDVDASLEGLLFPDTYRFAQGESAREIVSKMVTNFVDRTADLNLTYDQVILASIIEREAKADIDRSKIAGVYQNRLDNNMKLDADPTVQYAKDTQAATTSEVGKWWTAVTVTDYQGVKSPYNTYRQAGLPPTPIANPGLKSLTAAIAPEQHSYYYFLHPQTGETIYSKTLEDHNRAKRS